MASHVTGTRDDWLKARIALLEEEKELTRRSDRLARKRQDLPWVAVDKEYVFGTPAGPRTLPDLFDGREQLLVYHFMLGPNTPAGCVGCTYAADNFAGAFFHLAQHGVTFICASRAELPEIEAYKERMGWKFPWVSSAGTDFNLDFSQFTGSFNFDSPGGRTVDTVEGDELMALSSFALEDGVVYHTYSAFDRGTDVINPTWQLLDRAPLGREVGAEGFPVRRDTVEAR
ncbi:MAG TPA: DUF899 domain-containing protein [Thermoleophilaceae bacterium]|nr:DUF899 domain-containing protein [Thermoleophilaceae bacterium]